MFCTECGQENRNDRKFCSNCGHPLKDYTKPRENLIMPEEIENKKQTVIKKNKINKMFGIFSYTIMIVAIVFTALTFVTKNGVQLAFTITALSLYLIFFILIIVKVSLVHRLNKKLEKENNEIEESQEK